MNIQVNKLYNIVKGVVVLLILIIAMGCSEPDIDINTPPSLTITSHSNGELVSGTIVISGTATDSEGLSKIEISFDAGTTYVLADGTENWQKSFNTTSLADGNFYIKVKATDKGDFTDFGSLTLIIDNAGPTVQIITPQDAQRISGYVAIVGLGDKVDSVEVKIDNGSFQTVTGNYTWYIIWDTTLETEGAHTITARGVRGAFIGDEVVIDVVVDQTVPSVSITDPAIGAYIKGAAVNIGGTSSDNNGIDKIEISIDGGLNYVTASGTTSWSYNLDSTTVADGAMVIWTRAKDLTGLMGLTQIPVTVDNNPPDVLAITSHTTDELVSGIINVTGTANDTVGLQKVEVKFGPLAYQLADGTNLWNYDFNTESIPNGSYEVRVRATDFADNETETVITLLVDQNFPTLDSILADVVALNDNDYLNGTVAITGTASDLDGALDIDQVELKVDDEAYDLCEGTDNWSYSLATTAYTPDQLRTITVKVTDTIGGYSTITRDVNFDNTDPNTNPVVPIITNPIDAANVAGTVLITGVAEDNMAIDTVVIDIVDGGGSGPNINQDVTPGSGIYWQYTWDVDAQTLNTHSITVTVTDKAGNSSNMNINVTRTTNVPSISITSPLNGAYVKGTTLALTGNASGTGGATVSWIYIQVDTDPTPPEADTYTQGIAATAWSHTLDTTSLTEGLHTIYAIVEDNGAIQTMTQIMLTVDNILPTVTIGNPNDLDTVYGDITISGTASDTNLDLVQIDIDDGGAENFVDALGTTNYTYNWDTATDVSDVAMNGVIITAKAIDLAGNENTTSITVDVHPHIDNLTKEYPAASGQYITITSGIIGETIRITGDNFSAASTVNFDDAPGTAIDTFVDSSTIDVAIPAGATSGDVTVTTNGINSNGVHLSIWNIDTVPDSDKGSYSNLVIDSADNIYLSFRGESKSVDFSINNGAWATTNDIVVTGGGGPRYTSVGNAGATGQNVYIAYYNSDDSELEMATSINDGAAFPTIVDIPPAGAVDGSYPSLGVYYNGVASQDYIYISYYNTITQDLWMAKSIDSGASFTTELVDDTSLDIGEYSSLELDSQNNPHIAYYDAANRDLKYAYWDDQGLIWRRKTVDSSTAGEYASLDIGSADSIHISYYNGNYGDLMYAYASAADGTFTTEIVDETGITGWYTAIALDDNDVPHISYYDFTIGSIRYAEKTTGTWNLLTVPETEVVDQSFTSIDLDNTAIQNIQWISYSAASGIRVAHYLP